MGAPRKLWTLDEEKILTDLYPHKSTAVIAEMLNRCEAVVRRHAEKIGLRKSQQYKDSRREEQKLHMKQVNQQKPAVRVDPFKSRKREPGEAVSVSVCNASTTEHYRAGHGEVWQPARAGSMVAYGLPSRGIDAL